MKHLNTSLRLIRQFHRLKQKELAAKLEISPSHLSEIEGGTKNPSIDLLEKYSQVFHLPTSSIMMFVEIQNKGADAMEYKIADKALKMLEWLTLVGTEADAK